jgi:hypothetical protein
VSIILKKAASPLGTSVQPFNKVKSSACKNDVDDCEIDGVFYQQTLTEI